jgi:hypothetical protein
MESNKSTIVTPRGTFKIQESFSSEKEARSNGYGLYFTHWDEEDKRIDIFSKSLDENSYKHLFAIVIYEK